MEKVKGLYSDRRYSEAVTETENLLPHLDNPRVKSEAHLLMAKCHKNLGDLKTSIICCNLSIQAYSKWKDPYLFRSACFQALQTSYQENDGDTEENINQDRTNADIIVDQNCTPTPVKGDQDDEKERMRYLFRREEKKKIFVQSIEEALRLVPNGGKIFIEKGRYEVSSKSTGRPGSYFVFGKSISIIGASAAECVLLYRCRSSEVNSFEVESKLETFLIASNSNQPTLIKRLTFRNCNPAGIRTKFLGVAGGTVQLEDCVFDGVSSPDVDAVYANSKICGQFSANYPSPYLIARFCIFDHCQSYGTLTGLQSCVNISSSYFTGCGRMVVAALDSSKVTIENSEFNLSPETVTTVSSTSSDLTVTGCYFNGVHVDESDLLATPPGPHQHCDNHTGNGEVTQSSHEDAPVHNNGTSEQPSLTIGVGATLKSVVKVTNNYFYRLGSGVSTETSDLTCTENMFYCCSQRGCNSTLSNSCHKNGANSLLHSAVVVKCKSKVNVMSNLMKHCDVGVAASKSASPAVRENVFDCAFLAGIFCEDGSKPLIVGNTFNGGEVNTQGRGVGCLFLLSSGGMVAKNSFEDFSVSPLLIFTNCHPLIRENRYESIEVKDELQAQLETRLVSQFQSEVEKDSYFYLIESSSKESALADIILKGQGQAEQ